MALVRAFRGPNSSGMNVASGSEAGFITRKLVVSWVNRFDLLHVCAPISSGGSFFVFILADSSHCFWAIGERSGGATPTLRFDI